VSGLETEASRRGVLVVPTFAGEALMGGSCSGVEKNGTMPQRVLLLVMFLLGFWFPMSYECYVAYG
jgi:hypothetical protein